ncbi:MAG TPA: RecX family transcriptional regulator [Croceibacterium sp.]|nr:RecX family transcriptional regulator [Croceibacterium sp.]
MGGHETSRENAGARARRQARPLDTARLEELALAYVARFATSATKLERYLARKLRERGWDDERDPDLAALVARYVAIGYVDDEAYARAKSGSLLRRGYGPRRVRQALGEAGIAEPVREAVRPGAAAERRAALALARKRGFGPFGAVPADRRQREKQLAAMLRAGHTLDSAREIVDAASEQAAEQWAADCDDEER